jgi:undecaprenyl diphosphate synthase
MDGNRRWARQRHLPAIVGHRKGVNAVRTMVEQCAKQGIEILTLFAFSSENWQRPKAEVEALMALFGQVLQREINSLVENQVRLTFIGDRQQFSSGLVGQMDRAEQLTAANDGLHLVIAANYGGRWDITQACRQVAEQVASGAMTAAQITDRLLAEHLCLAGLPEPDLLIRTSGEQRISNFLLWQLAYTELYFTDTYWPDFSTDELNQALACYAQRQRRFGHNSSPKREA